MDVTYDNRLCVAVLRSLRLYIKKKRVNRLYNLYTIVRKFFDLITKIMIIIIY